MGFRGVIFSSTNQFILKWENFYVGGCMYYIDAIVSYVDTFFLGDEMMSRIDKLL